MILLLLLALWAVLIPLVLLSAFRIVEFEEWPVVMLAQTFTPFIYLPAHFVAIAAAALCRWLMLAVAVSLVLLHLWWIWPEIKPASELPAQFQSATTGLTLFSQNVKFDQPRPGDVGISIAQADADVVFLQEMTPDVVRDLRNSGVLNPYPHSFLMPEWGAAGMGIWSKLPLSQTSFEPLSVFPAQRAVVQIGDRPVTLWNIHTQSPPIDPGLDGGSLSRWHQDLEEVKGLLHGESGNVVAAGDFNSVWAHRPYREIVQGGYRDEHIELGLGHVRTWPVNGALREAAGGYIRIDHVLSRGDIRATELEATPGRGSDHKGLRATFVVNP